MAFHSTAGDRKKLTKEIRQILTFWAGLRYRTG